MALVKVVLVSAVLISVSIVGYRHQFNGQNLCDCMHVGLFYTFSERAFCRSKRTLFSQFHSYDCSVMCCPGDF